MSKFLFYVIWIVITGVIIALVLKITSLPENFWSYFFAGGFIMTILTEVFGLFYKKLFPGEKMFRRKIQN